MASVVLGTTMVMLTVGVGAMGWTVFAMAGNGKDTAGAFFVNNKVLVMAPAVMNVLSIALLCVLLVMG